MQVGAINDEEEITALGHHLAALPVDVRIGKVCNLGIGMWVLGHIFNALNNVVVALDLADPLRNISSRSIERD